MAENYVLLERTELNASAASVTFANIPQTGYTDLKIVMSMRNVTNTETTGAVYFNSDTTNANYSARRLLGDGSSASSANTANPYFFYMDTTGETANTFSNCEMYIPNYTGSTQKSVSVESVTENNATSALAVMVAGLWTGTAAINTIQIRPYTAGGGSFASGSTFSLYGIAALVTTPAIAPKADGGNIIATDGTYWYHAFTSSGSFVPQTGLICDVLVVAGGGSGGYSRPGGGGAGGLLAFTSQSFSTNQTVTIGAGGTFPAVSGVSGNSGSNSQIGSLTAAAGGGGGGGGAGAVAGIAGGSSGGSGESSASVVSPSPSGQGSAGGRYNGGGGGATQAGADGYGLGTTATGKGGDGSSAYSSWGSATNTGQNVSGTYWYAGGGAGYPYPLGTASGGKGGGGNNVYPSSPNTAGTVNTGGGGCADPNGAGGSGIIIVRYPAA
jgi:hypothetical protein